MDKIKEIKITDKDYPEGIKKLSDAPEVLYYKGVLPTPEEICDLFEESIKKIDKELVINFITVTLKKVLNYNKLKLRETKLNKNNFIDLLKLIEKNEITYRMGDLLLRKLIHSNKTTKDLAKELGFEKVENFDKSIDKVLSSNKEAVNDYKKGILMFELTK